MMTGDAVFVTGATGIVGGAVARSLVDHGVPVIAAVRSEADATRVATGVHPRIFDFGMPPRTDGRGTRRV
ncbi:NAD-dependent epimerase/dehydratase family protein [Microbacterium alcoholitolerans]|uniref:NAD-dependent epimerase/dehydratase family protein n=1 Tax=unclassified Microbacterium TaxID=2609290 RepID=UPI003D172C83